MSFTKIHLVLLIVSISILFAPTTHAAGTTEARIWRMCKPTTNPVLCYKTVLPKALVTPKFNIYKALEVEIQATQASVLKTATSIATLLWKSGTNKDIADSLVICKDQYQSIIEAVTESVSFVSKRNVEQARYNFSAVISYYLACQELFEEGPTTTPSATPTTSPIAADAEAVHQHSVNCLDLMEVIEKKLKRG